MNNSTTAITDYPGTPIFNRLDADRHSPAAKSVGGAVQAAIVRLFLTGTGPGFQMLENSDLESLPTTGILIIETSSASEDHLKTASEMLAEIEAFFGFNISQLATINRVSRPTIYSWKNGEALKEKNFNRLNALYSLIGLIPEPHARYISRFFKIVLPTGLSTEDLLSSDVVDADKFIHAYQCLEPSIQAAIERKGKQKADIAGSIDDSINRRDFPGA